MKELLRLFSKLLDVGKDGDEESAITQHLELYLEQNKISDEKQKIKASKFLMALFNLNGAKSLNRNHPSQVVLYLLQSIDPITNENFIHLPLLEKDGEPILDLTLTEHQAPITFETLRSKHIHIDSNGLVFQYAEKTIGDTYNLLNPSDSETMLVDYSEKDESGQYKFLNFNLLNRYLHFVFNPDDYLALLKLPDFCFEAPSVTCFATAKTQWYTTDKGIELLPIILSLNPNQANEMLATQGPMELDLNQLILNTSSQQINYAALLRLGPKPIQQLLSAMPVTIFIPTIVHLWPNLDSSQKSTCLTVIQNKLEQPELISLLKTVDIKAASRIIQHYLQEKTQSNLNKSLPLLDLPVQLLTDPKALQSLIALDTSWFNNADGVLLIGELEQKHPSQVFQVLETDGKTLTAFLQSQLLGPLLENSDNALIPALLKSPKTYSQDLFLAVLSHEKNPNRKEPLIEQLIQNHAQPPYLNWLMSCENSMPGKSLGFLLINNLHQRPNIASEPFMQLPESYLSNPIFHTLHDLFQTQPTWLTSQIGILSLVLIGENFSTQVNNLKQQTPERFIQSQNFKDLVAQQSETVIAAINTHPKLFSANAIMTLLPNCDNDGNSQKVLFQTWWQAKLSEHSGNKSVTWFQSLDKNIQQTCVDKLKQFDLLTNSVPPELLSFLCYSTPSIRNINDVQGQLNRKTQQTLADLSLTIPPGYRQKNAVIIIKDKIYVEAEMLQYLFVAVRNYASEHLVSGADGSYSMKPGISLTNPSRVTAVNTLLAECDKGFHNVNVLLRNDNTFRKNAGMNTVMHLTTSVRGSLGPICLDHLDKLKSREAFFQRFSDPSLLTAVLLDPVAYAAITPDIFQKIYQHADSIIFARIIANHYHGVGFKPFQDHHGNQVDINFLRHIATLDVKKREACYATLNNLLDSDEKDDYKALAQLLDIPTFMAKKPGELVRLFIQHNPICFAQIMVELYPILIKSDVVKLPIPLEFLQRLHDGDMSALDDYNATRAEHKKKEL